MYIENIVIGKPIVEPSTMFAADEDDWKRTEKEKTYYTDEKRPYNDLFYEYRMIKTDKTVPIKELVERFIEIDKEYNSEPWNIKQILANINIIIPVEDR